MNPSDSNPHHADNNIHPLRLGALIFEAPHAVLLTVPVGASSRVHAPLAHPGRRVGSGALLLDDGAVDDVFEGWLQCAVRCGFGDEGLEDFVLEWTGC